MPTPPPPPHDVIDPALKAPPRRVSGLRRLRLFARRRGWVTILAGLVLAVVVAAALVPGWFSSYDPIKAVPSDRLFDFGQEGHLLGTDAIGRDIFSRLVHGARLALLVGLSVALGAMVLGGVLGAVAGYFGGWFDSLVARVVDAALAFPPILLGLVLGAILGPGMWTAILALTIVFTPLTARVMRASVMSERIAPYVLASEGLGHTSSRTLVLEVCPNTVGPMLVVATLIASRAIIVEASLSFLGVGTQQPSPSWGLMATEAAEQVFVRPSLVVVPVIVLGLVVLSINLLGDAMADWLDPQNRVASLEVR